MYAFAFMSTCNLSLISTAITRGKQNIKNTKRKYIENRQRQTKTYAKEKSFTHKIDNN